jgi:hypothetical protein
MNIYGHTFSCHSFLEAEGQRTGFGTCSRGLKNTTLNVAVVSQGVVRPLGVYDRQSTCSNLKYFELKCNGIVCM